MPDRLAYFTDVLMPAAMVCWELENTGLRVDVERKRAHVTRLEGEREGLLASLRASPLVIDALEKRAARAAMRAGELAEQREVELATLNYARRCWEEAVAAGVSGGLTKAAAKRAAGPMPPLARKSSFTGALAKARSALDAAANFNPGSSRQKAWLLFDVCGLPVQKHRGTGAVTTDKAALAHLLTLKRCQERPEIAAVVRGLRDYEHIDQLLTTFARVEITNGRLYYKLGLHRTSVGRMSSGGDAIEKSGASATNIQNWPPELRDIVVPEPGFVLIHADWSALHVMLIYHFAGDEDSWNRAVSGEDQHRRLAVRWLKCAPDDVPKAQRDIAKRVKYGSLYGAGERKVAEVADVPIKVAREVMEADRQEFPLVGRWRDDVIALAHSQKYLETVYGWRRWFWADYVPDILASLPIMTEADMMKIRLPQVAKLFKAHGGRLLIPEHDAFTGEAPIERGQECASALLALMQYPFRLLGGRSFPAEVKVGGNWKEVS